MRCMLKCQKQRWLLIFIIMKVLYWKQPEYTSVYRKIKLLYLKKVQIWMSILNCYLWLTLFL